MVEVIERQSWQRPEAVLADSGYCSEKTLAALESPENPQKRIAGYIATERQKHDEYREACPKGPLPKGATRVDRMRSWAPRPTWLEPPTPRTPLTSPVSTTTTSAACRFWSTPAGQQRLVSPAADNLPLQAGARGRVEACSIRIDRRGDGAGISGSGSALGRWQNRVRQYQLLDSMLLNELQEQKQQINPLEQRQAKMEAGLDGTAVTTASRQRASEPILE